MRGGGPPFIGGEEGMSMEYSPPNRHLGSLNMDETSISDLGKAVRGSPCEIGMVGPAGGAPATWLGPTAPIFGG